MTKVAWLKSTSYPGMWLMVAQGPVKDWRKRKLAMGFVSCREGAGPEDSRTSCVRQVEERYRAEQPEKKRKQSTALGPSMQCEGEAER